MCSQMLQSCPLQMAATMHHAALPLPSPVEQSGSTTSIGSRLRAAMRATSASGDASWAKSPSRPLVKWNMPAGI